MRYEIHPPIGIARVGNSKSEFFICPETPGSPGTELTNGTEKPVERYKDAQYRMKRQAARFRIFEFDDAGGAGRPAQLPPGTVVTWKVVLANKKDGVVRPSSPDTESPTDPRPPTLPTLDTTRTNRVIAAEGSIHPGGSAVPLAGSYLTGTTLATRVDLGELQVDRDGNLLVLGGFGISRSPEDKPIGNEQGGGGYYDNRGWYDDVSDGPVSATIDIPGQGPIPARPAWVIVGPPDFAPATAAVVTLYDVLYQVALGRNEITLPTKPSFSRDVWPMLRRAAGLTWVNGNAYWSGFSTKWADLANPSPSMQALRQDMAKRLREIRPRRALANFSLRPWQQKVLDAWVAGNFESDFNGSIPGAGALSPELITRTVLDATAGQGFFPGIEAGFIVANPTLYAAPFRIASHVQAGDLTALMALPWQADFLDCAGAWWPSNRPDVAAQEADPASFLPWIRPIDPDDGHRDLVEYFGRLGVIVPKQVGGVEAFVEVDRDPSF